MNIVHPLLYRESGWVSPSSIPSYARQTKNNMIVSCYPIAQPFLVKEDSMQARQKGSPPLFHPSPHVIQTNKRVLCQKTKECPHKKKEKRSIAKCRSRKGIGIEQHDVKKAMSDLRPDANVFEPGKTPMSRVMHGKW
jgi:hypothetical protein